MSVAKVIEISAESTSSFEDAIATGIQRAGTSVEHIRGAWVKEQEVTVADNAIQKFRVKLKVTFELKA